MRSRRYLHLVTSVIVTLVLFAAVPLSSSAALQHTQSTSAAADAPSAGAHYVIFTTNRIPIVNRFEIGTLTIDVTSGNPSAFSYSWSFRGTVNGSPASAAGTGTGSGNANHLTLVLPASSISSWNIPGFPEPIHVKTAYLDRNSGFFFFSSLYFLTLHDFVDFPQPIVSGVPVSVFPSVNGNLTTGNHYLFESSIGTGSTIFGSLPGFGSRFGGTIVFPVVRGF